MSHNTAARLSEPWKEEDHTKFFLVSTETLIVNHRDDIVEFGANYVTQCCTPIEAICCFLLPSSESIVVDLDRICY